MTTIHDRNSAAQHVRDVPHDRCAGRVHAWRRAEKGGQPSHAYVLGIHALLLLTAPDDWPFTTYPLIEKVSSDQRIYRKIVFDGVDSSGREWPVDPDAWSPVSPPVLMQ